MNHRYAGGLAVTAASLLIAAALLVGACGGSEESTVSADVSLGESGSIAFALTDINSDEAIIAVADDGTMSAVMPGTAADAWVDDVVQMEFK